MALIILVKYNLQLRLEYTVLIKACLPPAYIYHIILGIKKTVADELNKAEQDTPDKDKSALGFATTSICG